MGTEPAARRASAVRRLFRPLNRSGRRRGYPAAVHRACAIGPLRAQLQSFYTLYTQPPSGIPLGEDRPRKARMSIPETPAAVASLDELLVRLEPRMKRVLSV